FLSQLTDDEFGSPVRDYPADDPFKVRPYWLPLERGRVETFHFDPPLRGEELYVVVGRSNALAAPLQPPAPPPRLKPEFGGGGGATGTRTSVFDSDFAPGEQLGGSLDEVDWRRLPLQAPLRTLGMTLEEGANLRLVGLSLLPARGEAVEPLF